jgi:hypothetical protein
MAESILRKKAKHSAKLFTNPKSGAAHAHPAREEEKEQTSLRG